MRTKTVLRTLALTAAAVALSVTLYSCGHKEDFKQELTDYLKKDLPQNTVKSDKYAAYFDFTGVYIAYNDPQTKQTFNNLTQKVIGSAAQFDIYSLANDSINTMTGRIDVGDIFQKLHDPSEQKTVAPIEKTLQKIVDEGRPALLVTDFEEYRDGVVYKDAYATPHFKKWLQKGGDIKFYVTDYQEGALSKHLYYVVFDYNQHPLRKMVDDALNGAPVNYQTFTLAINDYPMATAYPSAKQGGTYHNEDGEDVVSLSLENGKDDDGNAFFSMDSLRAESYGFQGPWQDIVNNAKDATLGNGYKVPFTHLFSKLFIDLSGADSAAYNIKALAVRVTDVQDDFEDYTHYLKAINNAPIKKKDGDGSTYLDWDGHEEGEEYYDEQGNLMPEYDYPAHKPDIKEIKDMLTFDTSLFNSTRNANAAHTELAVNFDPHFTGVIAGMDDDDANDLLRIDIVIADASICPQQRINQLFAWTGNDCLAQSVRNVLDELLPVGRPIFSYFVRIL